MTLNTTICSALGLLILLGACDSGTPETEPASELGDADQSYTLRGELKSVQPTELAIRHEAIGNFVNEQGETVGMDSMTMPFVVGPGLSVTNFSEGDKVEFTFEVRWKSGPRLLIRSLVQLPSTTELDFSKVDRGATVEEAEHEGHDQGAAAETPVPVEAQADPAPEPATPAAVGE